MLKRSAYGAIHRKYYILHSMPTFLNPLCIFYGIISTDNSIRMHCSIVVSFSCSLFQSEYVTCLIWNNDLAFITLRSIRSLLFASIGNKTVEFILSTAPFRLWFWNRLNSHDTNSTKNPSTSTTTTKAQDCFTLVYTHIAQKKKYFCDIFWFPNEFHR